MKYNGMPPNSMKFAYNNMKEATERGDKDIKAPI